MAVDIFIRIGDLKGEARDEAHADEIDVLAWSWGMMHADRTPRHDARSGSRVEINDLSFTKYVDRSSPSLMTACSSGMLYPEARLTVRRPGDARPLEYLVITLKEVRVSSLATGGCRGEDRLTENVTLTFAQVRVEYQPQKDDGTKDGEPVAYGWDIRENATA